MSETIGVAFAVLGIERVAGSGGLVALANVELDVCGVVLVIQGVRVIREGGNLAVRSPAFRCASGRWRSALVLPDSLTGALAAEVLEAYAAHDTRPR